MQLGTPKEVYEYPNNHFIADFIGESSLLPVSIRDNETHFRGEPIELAEPASANGEFLLVVRPEKAFLAAKKIKGSNYFEGILIDSIFQGESQLLVVNLNSGSEIAHELRVRVPNGSVTQKALPKVGETITIGLKIADSYLVS